MNVCFFNLRFELPSSPLFSSRSRGSRHLRLHPDLLRRPALGRDPALLTLHVHQGEDKRQPFFYRGTIPEVGFGIFVRER